MASDLPRIRDPDGRRENHARSGREDSIEPNLQTNYLYHIALRLDRLVEIMEADDE